jgi:hypothetical protein
MKIYINIIKYFENMEVVMGWTCGYNGGNGECILYAEFCWRGSVGKRPLGRPRR